MTRSSTRITDAATDIATDGSGASVRLSLASAGLRPLLLDRLILDKFALVGLLIIGLE